MTYGTLSVLDALASSQQSVIEIGENAIYAQVAAALAAHNAVVDELMAAFVAPTMDVRRGYGGTASMQMDEIDEFGRPDAQKIVAGALLDFPLRKYGISVQWTKDALEVITGQEFAAQLTAAQDADLTTFQREIKRALFRSANYTTVDRLVNNATLSVKRLLNADGTAIPLGPNGESFNGATHTHYLYTAGVALAAADITALVETVIEHHPAGTPRIWINRAQETAIRGITGFTPYLDARIVAGGGTTGVVATQSLSSMDLNNREIGLFSAGGISAVVTVKPWIPSGYLLAWVDGAPEPLVRRMRRADRAALRIVAEEETHPLRARTLEREHGFGVWNRTNGAVLFVDAGAAGAYVDPTLN